MTKSIRINQSARLHNFYTSLHIFLRCPADPSLGRPLSFCSTFFAFLCGAPQIRDRAAPFSFFVSPFYFSTKLNSAPPAAPSPVICLLLHLMSVVPTIPSSAGLLTHPFSPIRSRMPLGGADSLFPFGGDASKINLFFPSRNFLPPPVVHLSM